MPKFTPWFDAKLHSPAHEGWYDCKECNARHYFKDGLWSRDKKSLRVGPMSSRKMHWRGLERPSLKSLLALCDPNLPRSKEEQEWLDMVPVGREFGSPDYERLMEEDSRKIQDNLMHLVSKCRGLYDPQRDPLDDKKVRKDASNVQAALKELGFDVTVEDAATVWVRHSNSLCAGWMAGAETIKHAKLALISYCALGTDDFMRRVQEQPLQDKFDADIRRSLKEVVQGKIMRFKFGKSTKE
jgi:hypothetical protein